MKEKTGAGFWYVYTLTLCALFLSVAFTPAGFIHAQDTGTTETGDALIVDESTLGSEEEVSGGGEGEQASSGCTTEAIEQYKKDNNSAALNECLERIRNKEGTITYPDTDGNLHTCGKNIGGAGGCELTDINRISLCMSNPEMCSGNVIVSEGGQSKLLTSEEFGELQKDTRITESINTAFGEDPPFSPIPGSEDGQTSSPIPGSEEEDQSILDRIRRITGESDAGSQTDRQDFTADPGFNEDLLTDRERAISEALRTGGPLPGEQRGPNIGFFGRDFAPFERMVEGGFFGDTGFAEPTGAFGLGNSGAFGQDTGFVGGSGSVGDIGLGQGGLGGQSGLTSGGVGGSTGVGGSALGAGQSLGSGLSASGVPGGTFSSLNPASALGEYQLQTFSEIQQEFSSLRDPFGNSPFAIGPDSTGIQSVVSGNITDIDPTIPIGGRVSSVADDAFSEIQLVGETVSGQGFDLGDFAPSRLEQVAPGDLTVSDVQEIAADNRLPNDVVGEATRLIEAGDSAGAGKLLGEAIQTGESGGLYSGFTNTLRNGVEQLGALGRTAVEGGKAFVNNVTEAVGIGRVFETDQDVDTGTAGIEGEGLATGGDIIPSPQDGGVSIRGGDVDGAEAGISAGPAPSAGGGDRVDLDNLASEAVAPGDSIDRDNLASEAVVPEDVRQLEIPENVAEQGPLRQMFDQANDFVSGVFELFSPATAQPREVPSAEAASQFFSAAQSVCSSGLGCGGMEPQQYAKLLAAQAHWETGFDPDIVGPRGSLGLTQVQPGTARLHAGTYNEIFNKDYSFRSPQDSVNMQAVVLASEINNCGGDVGCGLRAYNAGFGNKDVPAAYRYQNAVTTNFNYANQNGGLLDRGRGGILINPTPQAESYYRNLISGIDSYGSDITGSIPPPVPDPNPLRAGVSGSGDVDAQPQSQFLTIRGTTEPAPRYQSLSPREDVGITDTGSPVKPIGITPEDVDAGVSQQQPSLYERLTSLFDGEGDRGISVQSGPGIAGALPEPRGAPIVANIEDAGLPRSPEALQIPSAPTPNPLRATTEFEYRTLGEEAENLINVAREETGLGGGSLGEDSVDELGMAGIPDSIVPEIPLPRRNPIATGKLFDDALREIYSDQAEYEQARKIFFERFAEMPERFRQPLLTMLRKMNEAGYAPPGDSQPIMLVDASGARKGAAIMSLTHDGGLVKVDGRNVEMPVGIAAKGPINWGEDFIGSNKQAVGAVAELTGAERRGDKNWGPGAIYTKELGKEELDPRSTWIHGGGGPTLGCVSISDVCSLAHQAMMEQVNGAPGPGQPGREFQNRSGVEEGRTINGGFTYTFAQGEEFAGSVGGAENIEIAARSTAPASGDSPASFDIASLPPDTTADIPPLPERAPEITTTAFTPSDGADQIASNVYYESGGADNPQQSLRSALGALEEQGYEDTPVAAQLRGALRAYDDPLYRPSDILAGAEEELRVSGFTSEAERFGDYVNYRAVLEGDLPQGVQGTVETARNEYGWDGVGSAWNQGGYEAYLLGRDFREESIAHATNLLNTGQSHVPVPESLRGSTVVAEVQGSSNEVTAGIPPPAPEPNPLRLDVSGGGDFDSRYATTYGGGLNQERTEAAPAYQSLSYNRETGVDDAGYYGSRLEPVHTDFSDFESNFTSLSLVDGDRGLAPLPQMPPLPDRAPSATAGTQGDGALADFRRASMELIDAKAEYRLTPQGIRRLADARTNFNDAQERVVSGGVLSRDVTEQVRDTAEIDIGYLGATDGGGKAETAISGINDLIDTYETRLASANRDVTGSISSPERVGVGGDPLGNLAETVGARPVPQIGEDPVPPRQDSSDALGEQSLFANEGISPRDRQSFGSRVQNAWRDFQTRFLGSEGGAEGNQVITPSGGELAPIPPESPGLERSPTDFESDFTSLPGVSDDKGFAPLPSTPSREDVPPLPTPAPQPPSDDGDSDEDRTGAVPKPDGGGQVPSRSGDPTPASSGGFGGLGGIQNLLSQFREALGFGGQSAEEKPGSEIASSEGAGGDTQTPRLSCPASMVFINGHGTTTVGWTCFNATVSRGVGFATGGPASGQVSFSVADPDENANTIEFGVQCVRSGEVVSSRTCDVSITRPVVSLLPSPSEVESGEAGRLVWSSAGVDGQCTMYGPRELVVAEGGRSGSARTPTLERATEFAVACTVGDQRIIKKAVVEVAGDDRDVERASIPAQGTESSQVPSSTSSIGSQASQTEDENTSGTFTATDAEGNEVQLCDPNLGITRFTWCLLRN